MKDISGMEGLERRDSTGLKLNITVGRIQSICNEFNYEGRNNWTKWTKYEGSPKSVYTLEALTRSEPRKFPFGGTWGSARLLQEAVCSYLQ